MTRVFAFRCNLADRKLRRSESAPEPLSTFGLWRNVEVKLDDIAKVFRRHLDGRIADALDIAAFVYAADSAVSRNRSNSVSDQIEPWSRSYSLEIGVRDPDFWMLPEVASNLNRVLSLLSDDKYAFKFEKLVDDRARQDYLNLGDSHDWEFKDPSRVLMFSGGLDSLAGAAERAAAGEKLVLVSHRSVPRMETRQHRLFEKLKETYPHADILRVPVWVHKTGNGRTGEYTQRTRSFLFWALGLAVGSSVNAGGISFFENGIVSLNLPVADQVLRARASKTTHPLALKYLEELAGRVLGRPFAVDNPFILLNKTEVVQTAIRSGASDLIQYSCSCAHTHRQRANAWHCGCCSQCIDRRLAIIAAGATALDPESDYLVPVLTGPREDVRDQTMAANYVRHAFELANMSHDQMAETFNGEIARAARAFPNPTRAAEDLIDMHRRHGMAIRKAIADGVATQSLRLFDGELASTSLLGLTIAQKHLQAPWTTLAERIGNILSRGIPIDCHSIKPKNEQQLQEICDGMLVAADEKLVREYPFLRWASRMTKPDWSDEEHLLWVELKYVRTSSDVRKSGEEIAADITKYGDNGRRVLFVVYDPSAHVLDPDGFTGSITRHAGNMVRIIR
nr:7-cyano-7-deazaguanine synthase [uncultured Rhodopila sp.]